MQEAGIFQPQCCHPYIITVLLRGQKRQKKVILSFGDQHCYVCMLCVCLGGCNLWGFVVVHLLHKIQIVGHTHAHRTKQAHESLSKLVLRTSL